jgi:hypothetical protein
LMRGGTHVCCREDVRGGTHVIRWDDVNMCGVARGSRRDGGDRGSRDRGNNVGVGCRCQGNVNAPEAGARGFPGTSEDVLTLAVPDCQGLAVQEGRAARITQFPETDEVVGETGDDVSGACGAGEKMRECQLSGGHGGLGFASGRVDGGAWRRPIEV